MSLNRYQTGAVEDPAPYVVVRAGAGTGKTRTLLARAIAEADRADRVRLVAFTRSAAREMRERLESMDLPDDVVRRIHVETLHGLSHSLLRSHGAEGLASDFSVIDEVDEQTIEKHAERHRESAQNIRARAGLVRYDDLLHLAERSLVTGRADNERGGSILVDEAQDLTAQEWLLIAALRPDRLTVMGDQAQALYAWRGGIPDPAIAGQYVQIRGGASGRSLPTNYRSLQGILDLANRLQIPGRVDLRAHRGKGGVVEVWQAISDAELAGRIVETMAWDSPGDWAILSRKKGRLASIAETLIDEGIPVHAPALAGLFWKSKEARAFQDQIHVAVNPHDTHHLRRVLEAAGWDRMDFARAEEGRARDACSLWDWSCRNVEPESQAADKLRRLEALRVSEASAHEAAVELAESWVCRLVPLDLKPAELLFWLANPDREPMAGDEAQDAVTLATVHGVKGREWRNVIVVGCEEGTLPLLRRDSDLEEERRLFYVATTRAADRLILAHCHQVPNAWGRGTTEAQRSRFLAEVGL